MQHPFETLRPEYEALMARMVIKKVSEVDAAARRLLRFYEQGNYTEVSKKTGVPIIFMATSFEREASSNFRLSPAQGDRWDRPSIHVPRNIGPFKDWNESAEFSYHIDGLDAVGAANWTWALLCFYGEIFNGFGYRDYHHEHTPYDWGGTNIQQPGKYVADNQFSASAWDDQLGIVPMARRMVELCPELEIPGWPAQTLTTAPIAKPQPAPLGVGGSTGVHDLAWVQHSLNTLNYGPISEDGDFGRETARTVRAYEIKNKLQVDNGFPGPEVIASLVAQLAQQGKQA